MNVVFNIIQFLVLGSCIQNMVRGNVLPNNASNHRIIDELKGLVYGLAVNKGGHISYNNASTMGLPVFNRYGEDITSNLTMLIHFLNDEKRINEFIVHGYSPHGNYTHKRTTSTPGTTDQGFSKDNLQEMALSLYDNPIFAFVSTTVGICVGGVIVLKAADLLFETALASSALRASYNAAMYLGHKSIALVEFIVNDSGAPQIVQEQVNHFTDPTTGLEIGHPLNTDLKRSCVHGAGPFNVRAVVPKLRGFNTCGFWVEAYTDPDGPDWYFYRRDGPRVNIAIRILKDYQKFININYDLYNAGGSIVTGTPGQNSQRLLAYFGHDCYVDPSKVSTKALC